MSDTTNAIKGNQSTRHDADTATRNDSKDNWQSWWARSIIGLVLLALAWYIATQDFGFFYKILIASGVWWLVSAAEPKLNKSEDYKAAVWFWPTIVKGAAILMLFLTILHSGFGQSTKRGVEVLEGEAACIADSGSTACTRYRAAQAALDAPQLARNRQAEIEQAAHDAEVELARAIVLASRHIPSSQVVDGCEHLNGVQNGLYRFVVDAEECRHVTVGPNEHYDAVKGPDITGPRCTRQYPVRTNVSYIDQPGPDRMINNGDAVEDFVVFFLKAGQVSPVDSSDICG